MCAMTEKSPAGSDVRPWRALIALCVGFFMILLDQTIVAVATPALQADLGATYNEVIWVTSAYLLFFAVPLLVTGRLGDKYGPKNVYILGMVLFTLSSLACGLAPSITWLIIARAAQGLGAALLSPQTMSVINRIFPRDRRGAALGVWGATAGLSTLVGPLLGGVITSLLSWQWVFLVNVPIGVISVVAVAKFVPTFPLLKRPIDALSIALSVVAMFLFIFSIQQGETTGWPWWIFAGMLAAVGIAALFIRRQAAAAKTDREPLLPLPLFARRSFAFGNIGIAAMGFAVAGMMLPIMLYLQQVHHFSPMRAGLMVVPMSVVSMICAPLVGRLVDRTDPRPVAIVGFSIMVLTVALLVLVLRPGVSQWWILPVTTLMGFGHAGVWAPNSTLTLRDLPHKWAGAGSGMYNSTRQLGAVTGAAVIGAVMQWRLAVGSPGAFGQSLIPAAVVLAIGVWSAWRGAED
ncbi:MFS transporter [Corynebacterium heidelbergense]|uniref:MFS transporter n=2 Tax=Corynebacterium heidelbergense TaxID=2055947 RepID=A0A364VBA7_9CORY|nr:MFS transporter [Corynebacterium heidelbergense]